MPTEIVVLFLKRRLKLLEPALAVGQGLLALADGLVLRGGGFSLPAFQLGPVFLDLEALAFDRVALGRQFLILELLFEIALSRGGLVVFLLKLGDFFGDIGRLLVTTGCREHDQCGERNQGWILHGFRESGRFDAARAGGIHKISHQGFPPATTSKTTCGWPVLPPGNSRRVTRAPSNCSIIRCSIAIARG